MEGLEILDHQAAGYSRVMEFGAWTVAIMNYAEALDFANRDTCRIERHNKTDEVFVLLEGTSSLLIGEDKQEVVMEKGKVYNVKAGVWHATLSSKDAKILIVENADTGADNTDRKYL